MVAPIPGKILVTGASGFTAAVIVDLLLKKGYHVRGTVRSKSKADQIAAQYAEYKDKLELVQADLSDEKSWSGILDGLTGIFHVATPLPNATSTVKEILDPAIQGTIALLEAAAKVPTIKRVVITSSVVAVADMLSGDSNYVYTEKDFNPITYDQAVASGNLSLAYAASKTIAEKAAWDFIRDKKPSFDLVTICPTMIFGPTTQIISSVDDLTFSPRRFYDFLTTKSTVDPVSIYDLLVDVRDVAELHLKAYENPKAANQRYLATTGPMSWQEVVNLAHKYWPGHVKTPAAPAPDTSKTWKIDTSKTQNELGIKFRTLEEVFHDMGAQFIELQKQGQL